MVHSGVKDVRDLLDGSNYNFVTYTAFITKYNTKTNYIECYKAVSALIKTGKMFPQSKPHSFRKSCCRKPPVCKKKNYQIIFKRKTSSPVKSQEKWLSEDIFSNVQVNWKNNYQPTFLCNMEIKVKSISISFLHRWTATSDFLLKIGN